jgi:hypothetical protein
MSKEAFKRALPVIAIVFLLYDIVFLAFTGSFRDYLVLCFVKIAPISSSPSSGPSWTRFETSVGREVLDMIVHVCFTLSAATLLLTFVFHHPTRLRRIRKGFLVLWLSCGVVFLGFSLIAYIVTSIFTGVCADNSGKDCHLLPGYSLPTVNYLIPSILFLIATFVLTLLGNGTHSLFLVPSTFSFFPHIVLSLQFSHPVLIAIPKNTKQAHWKISLPTRISREFLPTFSTHLRSACILPSASHSQQ